MTKYDMFYENKKKHETQNVSLLIILILQSIWLIAVNWEGNIPTVDIVRLSTNQADSHPKYSVQF